MCSRLWMSLTRGELNMRPKLHDWQENHADALTDALRLYGSALDASDTGVGKTVIALEVAARLERVPFVMCPKAVIPSWQQWMKETNGEIQKDHNLMKKYLNDPDNKYFRTTPTRV